VIVKQCNNQAVTSQEVKSWTFFHYLKIAIKVCGYDCQRSEMLNPGITTSPSGTVLWELVTKMKLARSRYHFVRDYVERGEVEGLTDNLTKALGCVWFVELR
jgi:hypothetical protein